jgi:hypothetical protein
MMVGMQVPTFLTITYAVIFLGILVMGGLFISIFRTSLKRMKNKESFVAKPATEGLTAPSLLSSMQSQILELQATEVELPEHAQRFTYLVEFLKESKNLLLAEAPMLELYILRLEALPSSDPGHLPTLAALFSWSQSRAKALLNVQA